MSKLKPKFYGKKINGEFVLNDYDRKYFEGYMNNFEDGEELEATYTKKYKKRTSGQEDEETNFNGYYWGVVVEMVAEEMGEYKKTDIHEHIQMEVGNTKILPSGKEVPKGTSEMSGGEFAEYCKRVRMWASKEMQLYIPEPHEVDY